MFAGDRTSTQISGAFSQLGSPTEKFLVAEIDSLSGNDEPCFAGNAHLAEHLQTSQAHMRDMLAELTARGYLVRLGFIGRQTLRCARPDLSSNPDGARRLINRYRKNPIQRFLREKTKRKTTTTTTQSKLHAQVAANQSVVVVASMMTNPPKLLRSSLKS